MRPVLALLGLACASCYQPDYGAAPFLCQRSDRCPTGYRCSDGVCRLGVAAADRGPAADRLVAPADRGPADGPGAADQRRDAPQPDATTQRDGPRPDAPLACPPGQGCEDGNPCTVDDQCNGSGACSGTPLPDGTSCGGKKSIVCCAARCVDISNDDKNCGGCGLACAAGYNCSDVAAPPACASLPTTTSGRCRCANGRSELCPKGQNCRTNTPADDWCSAMGDGECATGQHVVYVNSCPNYCAY